jgi:zinc protease
MKNALLSTLLIFSFSASLFAQTAIPLPDLKSKTLLNNLKIYMVETPQLGEQMTIGLVVRYGAAFDSEEKGGLANLLSRLFVRNAEKKEKEFEALGATLDIKCDWDSFQFIMKGKISRLEESLRLLNQIVVDAQFSDDDFAAIKQQVLKEIQSPLDPRRKIRAQMDALLFKDVPAYGRPLQGTVKTIKACTAGDARFFYHKFFIPNDSSLIIVGNNSSTLAVDKLPRIWGSWVKNDSIPSTFLGPKQPVGKQVFLDDDAGALSAQFIIGSLFPPRGLPKFKDYRKYDYRTYFHALVTARILQDRLTKLLPTSLVTVGFEGRQMEGPFYIQGQAAAEQTPEQIRKIIEAIEELRLSPVADDELSKAQQSLIDEFFQKFSSTEGICQMMLDAELYGLGENHMVNYPSWIRRCTTETVRQIAKEWILPGAFLIIRGPAATLKPLVAPLDSSYQQPKPEQGK